MAYEVLKRMMMKMPPEKLQELWNDISIPEMQQVLKRFSVEKWQEVLEELPKEQLQEILKGLSATEDVAVSQTKG